MKERDKSLNAMYSRYYKANIEAIVTHNGLTFDCIRDVPDLIDMVKKLQSDLEQKNIELAVLQEENKILKGEVINVGAEEKQA